MSGPVGCRTVGPSVARESSAESAVESKSAAGERQVGDCSFDFRQHPWAALELPAVVEESTGDASVLARQRKQSCTSANGRCSCCPTMAIPVASAPGSRNREMASATVLATPAASTAFCPSWHVRAIWARAIAACRVASKAGELYPPTPHDLHRLRISWSASMWSLRSRSEVKRCLSEVPNRFQRSHIVEKKQQERRTEETTRAADGLVGVPDVGRKFSGWFGECAWLGWCARVLVVRGSRWLDGFAWWRILAFLPKCQLPAPQTRVGPAARAAWTTSARSDSIR